MKKELKVVVYIDKRNEMSEDEKKKRIAQFFVQLQQMKKVSA